MTAATRTIRHLRLRGPSDAVLRRTAIKLEDALRTASLPDGGGRLLLVRRLALGRVEATASPSSLARALERAVARAQIVCLHGADPAAAQAGAVWFRDALEAHVACALRVLAGAPPHEWFWRLALPQVPAAAPRGGTLRSLAHSLAQLPEAHAALPRWFAALARAGHRTALASALQPADLPALARAARVPVSRTWTAAPCEEAAAARRAHADSGPAASRLDAGRETVAARSQVLRFVMQMLRAAGFSARDAAQALAPVEARAVPPRDAGETGPVQVPGAILCAVDAPPAVAAHRRAHAAAAARPPLRPRPAHGRPRPGMAGANDAGAPLLRTGRLRAPSGQGEAWTAPTVAGGLAFLLNALARLGYGEWLAAQPQWAAQEIARRVLARVLTRLRVDAADPAWTLAATPPAQRRLRRFIAPPRWRDGLLAGAGALRLSAGQTGGLLCDASGRLPLAAWHGARPRALAGDCRRARREHGAPVAPDEAAVRAWDIALRRWLRRYAHIGVADLVLRPARLAATPTHVDVWLDLRRADLRIRRTGLDLDCGWLPWLGRVVAFHYGPGVDG